MKHKDNHSRKDWWQIELSCENGKFKLEGNKDIPDCWLFDDTFVIGIADHEKNGETKVRFRVTLDNVSAKEQLRKEIDNFNKNAPKFGDSLYMHGLYSEDTFALDTRLCAEDTMQSHTFHNWGSKEDEICIDYMLTSKTGFNVNSYKVVTDTYDGVFVSDHYQLSVNLELE